MQETGPLCKVTPDQDEDDDERRGERPGARWMDDRNPSLSDYCIVIAVRFPLEFERSHSNSLSCLSK